MPKPPIPKTITISGDIGLTAALALGEYARDQKAKGYLHTAASIHRDAATIFRKINRVETAEFWEGVAAQILVEADKAEALKKLENYP
jgi:hypothetical protein